MGGVGRKKSWGLVVIKKPWMDVRNIFLVGSHIEHWWRCFQAMPNGQSLLSILSKWSVCIVFSVVFFCKNLHPKSS
jgi:hypothetical protein